MFSRVLTTKRESTGTSLKDLGSNKRSTSNIDEIMCGVTPSVCDAHLFTSHDPFVRKPETPPPQTCHVTISFPL